MNEAYPLKAQGLMIIQNDSGLHTRPATEIVKCAVKFKCDIKLIHKKQIISAKSLLGILMLAAKKGTRIKITAEGEDAKEAVLCLIKLAENHFYIGH
jgi:phosphocarrier protein HPr